MTGPRTWIAALRGSHDRLDSLISPLSPAQLAGPSYCSEWTIAQVLSHLGSGAEIFALFLTAGLAGSEPPEREQFMPIWEAWNSRSPQEQAGRWRSSDAAFVDLLESLGDDELARLHLELFGMNLDAVGLARMRLSEHTVHTWDVAVALDPAARLAADGVDLLAGTIGQLAQRMGKPQGAQFRVAVHSTHPRQDVWLTVGDTVQLADRSDQPADGELRLPSEAFIRLIYGRLDPRHTPADVTVDGVSLDTLRAVFRDFDA